MRNMSMYMEKVVLVDIIMDIRMIKAAAVGTIMAVAADTTMAAVM